MWKCSFFVKPWIFSEDRDAPWASPFRQFLFYKNYPDIDFPFSYEEYLNLPLFMIKDAHEFMDELIKKKEEQHKENQPELG